MTCLNFVQENWPRADHLPFRKRKFFFVELAKTELEPELEP